MPMLEREAPAPPDDNPTLDAIEAIRAVLMATVETDELADEPAPYLEQEDGQAEGLEAPAPEAAAVRPFGHGRIRLHGRD